MVAMRLKCFCWICASECFARVGLLVGKQSYFFTGYISLLYGDGLEGVTHSLHKQTLTLELPHF